MMKPQSRGTGLVKDLIKRMKVKYILFPDTYHPLTKDLLTTIPFTKYMTSSYQKKLQGILKRKKLEDRASIRPRHGRGIGHIRPRI